MDAKVRLFVDQPLGMGQAVALDESQAGYLFSVMRLGVGAGVRLFNGKSGEWRARVVEATKRRGVLVCEAQVGPQVAPPDLWLVFPPLRKERTAFVVEKAVELGVARIVPVRTAFTQGERWRGDKARAHAVEAAEQCGATFVPDLAEIAPLEAVLEAWPVGRVLLWADEALAGAQLTGAEGTEAEGTGAEGTGAERTGAEMSRGTPSALLIGPEGGFSDKERAVLRGCAFAQPIRLGPRILRAETAAIAALALWQARYGDWGGW